MDRYSQGQEGAEENTIPFKATQSVSTATQRIGSKGHQIRQGALPERRRL